MAKENVEIVFSANTQQARALYQEIAAGQDKVAQKAQQGNKHLESFVGTMAKIGAGAAIWGGITSAITRHNEELKKAGDMAKAFEETLTKALNLVGGSRADMGKLGADFGQLALRNRVSRDQAGAAATQLVGAGFDLNEVNKAGGSGDTFLQFLHAMNASGKEVDPAMLAESAAKFMQGHGLDKNARNLYQLTVPMHSMASQGLIKAEHLADMATSAGSLRNRGISPLDQMSIHSALVDVMPSSVAATGVQSLTARLASASREREVMRGLKMMGLSAEDVDMSGESFLDVIGRLKAGNAALPEKDRAGAFKLVAGTEQLKVLEALTGNLDVIQSRRRGASGIGDPNSAMRRAYEQAVMNRLTGRAAEETYEQTRADIAEEESGNAVRDRSLWIKRNRNRRAETAQKTWWGQTQRAMQDWFSEGFTEGSGAAGNRAVEETRAQRQEVIIKLPNQTRVPGVIKATENLEGMLKSAAGAGGGLN